MNKAKLIKIGFWLLPWLPLSYLVTGIASFQAQSDHAEPILHLDDQGHLQSVDFPDSHAFLQFFSLLPLVILVATIVFIAGVVLLVVGHLSRSGTAQTPN